MSMHASYHIDKKYPWKRKTIGTFQIWKFTQNVLESSISEFPDCFLSSYVQFPRYYKLCSYALRYANLLGDSAADQTDAEQDALKRTLLDTNPYLLAVTVCVSIVHSVFEFLAFKNGKPQFSTLYLMNCKIYRFYMNQGSIWRPV